ncbi:MAG: rod shape-determining protein [Clostridia bacterium]|nr:rod shape-determining protein [Clostridia bacterium]
MSTAYIGLKMGSTTTYIYKPGNGIVLREPTLVAVPTNPKVKEITAVGKEAKDLIGRVSENTSIISPIVDELIQYEDLTISMLKTFLKKVFPSRSFGLNIKAIVCTQLGLSPDEQKQLERVCFKAGIADVYLVPDVLCYALGAGIDISINNSAMVVNIGGNTTNIATISNNTIIDGYNLTIGGSILNIAIAKYIDETYGIKISQNQAEKIKVEICSLFDTYDASISITGIEKLSNSKKEITINADEIYPIVEHYYGKIAESIQAVIESSKPEVVSDIAKNGIYFYGGGTQIVGFERFMFNKLQFKINISENQRLNIIGTGELIKFPQLLKKILKNN